MSLSILNDKKYAVLVFYGFSHNAITMSNFYGMTVSWCQDIGYMPNKSLVHGDEFSGKCISFKHNHNKLMKKGFNSAVDFEFFAIPDNAKNPMFEYLIDVIYVGDASSSYAILSINHEIHNIIEPSQHNVVQSLIDCLKPNYGIGYLRELRKGPSFYAVGIGQGREIEEYSGDVYEENVRHCHWGGFGLEKQIHRQGVIRDIYPLNLLNSNHLEFSIEGSPLQEWIRLDKDRGTLTKITNEIWSWRISESSIPVIRPTLWDSGIIFNKNHYLNTLSE